MNIVNKLPFTPNYNFGQYDSSKTNYLVTLSNPNDEENNRRLYKCPLNPLLERLRNYTLSNTINETTGAITRTQKDIIIKGNDYISIKNPDSENFTLVGNNLRYISYYKNQKYEDVEGGINIL